MVGGRRGRTCAVARAHARSGARASRADAAPTCPTPASAPPRPPARQGDCSPTKWRRDVAAGAAADKAAPAAAAAAAAAVAPPNAKRGGADVPHAPGAADVSTPAAPRRAPPRSDQDATPLRTPGATLGFGAAPGAGDATPQACAHMIEAVEAAAAMGGADSTPGGRRQARWL
jgi:hypothetical protein